jgi:hypothetical protein
VIKEAIDKVIELDEIRMVEDDGRIYVRGREELKRVKRPDEHHPTPLKVGNLRTVVQYLVLNPDGLDLASLTIHVTDPFTVEVIGPLQSDNDNTRFTYLTARCRPNGFQFNRAIDLEEFVLDLQANFQRTGPLDEVVCMLANLANETIRQNIDDGFSQTLQIKTGLTTKAEVKVQNPIELVPFRTFREVEQPAGEFILRFKERKNAAPMVSLTIADGDAWELEAIAAIRTTLKGWLEEEALVVEVLS